MMWLRLAPLVVLGCSTNAPKDDPSGDGTLTPSSDSAAGPSDSGADSGEVPRSPCTGRGTTVSALNESGCITEAACTWDGDLSYLFTGYTVAGGQDFDGDGVEDFAVSSPFADTVVDAAAVYDVGQVDLISGADLVAGGTGALGSVVGLTEGEQTGTAVQFIGDIDGDGDSELLVGARRYSQVGMPDMGAVHLILGDPNPAGGALPIHRTWTGRQTYGRLGSAVVSPGDLDGDGIVELAIGGDLWEAEGAEAVEVFSAGRVYLTSGATIPGSGSITDFPVILEGTGATDQAGSALAGGDLDNDGYADLVIGAPYGSTTRGEVLIILGGADVTAPATQPVGNVAAHTLVGTNVGDAFGWSLAVGDVTGDGQPEVVVGAPLYDAVWGAEGALHVYAMDAEGSPTLLAQRFGEHDDHQLGTGIVAGRDLTGDGVGDLVVGAVAAWHELSPKSGRSYILSGGDGLTGDAVIETTRQVHATGAKDYLGRASAMADVDADGTADLILGSAYTNPDGRTDGGSVWLFFGG